MPSRAPISRTRASLSSELLVTSTRAFAAAANCSAKIDTPPVPCTRTYLSRSSFCPTVAMKAVRPAVGSVAASSYDSPFGAGTTAVSSSTMYSPSTPSTSKPCAPLRISLLAGPSVQLRKYRLVTRVPGRSCCTLLPTATMSPAASELGNASDQRATAVVASQHFPVAAIQTDRAHAHQHLMIAGLRHGQLRRASIDSRSRLSREPSCAPCREFGSAASAAPADRPSVTIADDSNECVDHACSMPQ